LNKTGVLHLVDSLASGGAEHVAVMLANNLPKQRYRVYLCASRQAGPLKSQIQPDVMFYDLRRQGRYDILAIMRLAEFTRREHIGIIHAHSSSLFLGAVISLLNPGLKLVWHDHTGLYGMKSRSIPLYRPFAQRAQVIFSVTRDLVAWEVGVLRIPNDRVFYLPNFIETQKSVNMLLDLPGKPGKRMVCVANIRNEKDPLTLLRAFAQVIKVETQAYLFLVGSEANPQLAEQAREESQRLGLQSNLIWMGLREDVSLILASCDIGVLSSVSEGFPVVLLEYGRAGLAVVATRVGECAEILEDGESGMLVPPSNPDSLASALAYLLKSPALRKRLGKRLAERVKQNFSAETIVQKVCDVYERIL